MCTSGRLVPDQRGLVMGAEIDASLGLARLRISFCCNDDRGNFTGRATAADLESLYRVGRHPWDAELVHDDWGRGVALTVDGPRMKLRIHRVWFPFKAVRTWYGNWCWDSFEFERSTGKRLLGVMQSAGTWHCEAGPSRFYAWWNVPRYMGSAAAVMKREQSERANG